MLFWYATIWLSFDNAFQHFQPDHPPFLLLRQERPHCDTGKVPWKMFFSSKCERCEKRFQIFQVFAKEVIEKVQELDQEKMKTEKAFHDFLPLTIVRDIKLKKVFIFIRQFFWLGVTTQRKWYQKWQFPPPRQFFIQVSAENFDCVTIFFGDIVGFNDLTNDCSATEVIESES